MGKAAFIVCVVALVSGCKKAGNDKFMHDEPHFTVDVPSDLTAGKDKTDANTQNLSIINKDGSRELFFVWAPLGSAGDPHGIFSRYGHEEDNTKIIEQGELPPNGKFVINERGNRTYIHMVITTGNQKWGVLCMASTNDRTKDADLLDACKSLGIN